MDWQSVFGPAGDPAGDPVGDRAGNDRVGSNPAGSNPAGGNPAGVLVGGLHGGLDVAREVAGVRAIWAVTGAASTLGISMVIDL